LIDWWVRLGKVNLEWYGACRKYSSWYWMT
jgi:hypothetical protein